MELLACPEECRRMIERQHQVINGNAAEDICEFIIRQGTCEERVEGEHPQPAAETTKEV